MKSIMNVDDVNFDEVEENGLNCAPFGTVDACGCRGV